MGKNIQNGYSLLLSICLLARLQCYIGIINAAIFDDRSATT